MFAGGLDFSSPVKKFFYDPLGSGRAAVDTVVSLTGFALVGGPARQDAPKAIEALTSLNVPYLCSLPLVFQVGCCLTQLRLGRLPHVFRRSYDLWVFASAQL